MRPPETTFENINSEFIKPFILRSVPFILEPKYLTGRFDASSLAPVREWLERKIYEDYYVYEVETIIKAVGGLIMDAAYSANFNGKWGGVKLNLDIQILGIRIEVGSTLYLQITHIMHDNVICTIDPISGIFYRPYIQKNLGIDIIGHPDFQLNRLVLCKVEGMTKLEKNCVDHCKLVVVPNLLQNDS